MKRIALVIVAFFCFLYAHAAYLKDIPMTLTQPDGTILHCYASGDEYFNYLHDANGYTIMQHPVTGYYVYADKQEGKLVATKYIAGKYDPASKNLRPYILMPSEEWRARRKAREVEDERPVNREFVPNHGTLNNIAIFIRFSDDGEFVNTFSSIDDMFNDESENAVSMKTYFRAASYGAIEIPTYFYPGHDGQTIISYQDSQPRSYYQPYNATTNPNGYQDSEESREREFSLLQRAVNYINTNYPIPSDLNIDYDDDGFVDNVCFIVRGTVEAWSSLLWPHKWSLYDREVYINGKRVYVFNFQLADASNYFNTSTMCHEMNHSLSAPDLYHYDDDNGFDPIAKWDLMATHTTPPQHCGAYMKMKYGHWISEIPEITQAGTYSLNPISSATPTNVAYKIKSQNPYQYYVLEYRDKTSLFDGNLYGSGLLIYRIDTRFFGNADYDPSNGIYDEVYIFRPGGTYSNKGTVSKAHFSANVGRTEFSPSTNPKPFFSDGTLDDNIRIYDISQTGSTISFKYGTLSLCDPPTNLTATTENRNVTLTWIAATGAQSYNIYRNGSLIGNTANDTYVDDNLSYGLYSYFLKSVDGNGKLSPASETIEVSIEPLASNLTAMLSGNGAELSWTSPEWAYSQVPSATLGYGTTDYNGSVGFNDGETNMYWGHLYPTSLLAEYENMFVYKVSFYAMDIGDYILYLYEGTTNDHPASQVAEQAFTITEVGWVEIELSTPYLIDASNDLWVFVYDPLARNTPATYCNTSELNGCYYSTDPLSWATAWNDAAFLIRTCLFDGNYTYNLYDGTTQLNNTAIEGTSFIDANPSDNTVHQYSVTTLYSGGETGSSNKAYLAIGNTSRPSLDLGLYDKMTVTENSKLTISGALVNTSPDNLILEDGAQLINDSEGVKATVKKALQPFTESTNDGWNLIASPVTESLEAEDIPGLLRNEYDLYAFDPSGTDSNGNAKEWRNYEADVFTDIEPKVGYLYANSDETTLSFVGTLAGTAAATELTLDAGTLFAGFNLIGNPYPCNAYIERSFYVLNYNADSDSTKFVLVDNDTPIAPCAAVLVQAQEEGESVTFSKTAPPTSSKIAVRLNHADQKGAKAIDQVRIMFQQQCQLAKYPQENSTSTIYIPQNGKKLAVANAEGLTELPINLRTAKNGSYTLSFETEKLDLNYLHLIDNMTGNDVDLLVTPSYTFEGKTTDYESRFRLVFATNCEDADGDDETFAYVSNGEIVIAGVGDACNTSLQVVDMTGRVIRCLDVARNVSTNGMTAGVYVLRLINGDDVKTQKIVIE